MARRRQDDDEPTSYGPPATNPRAREAQLVGLAYDLAEKQLREGTASSTVIASLLKAGSSREKLEQERLAHENTLTQAKTKHLEEQESMRAMFEEAMVAMGRYSGQPETEVPSAEDVYPG